MVMHVISLFVCLKHIYKISTRCYAILFSISPGLNVPHYAVFQFVVDASKKTHKTASKDDTHEWWLLFKEKKRAVHERKKLEQKLAAKKPEHKLFLYFI